jgi:hypothetical protein
MAYVVGDIIRAADINGFISNNTDDVNAIYSTGAGDSGYGQTALTTVAVGDLIAATNWSSLLTAITKIAAHQGTTITNRTNPSVGDLISIFAAVQTDISSCTTNRRNAASQGGTSANSGSNATDWSDKLVFTCTVTFSSADAARYYFNAGGQIGISASHVTLANKIDSLISDICSDMGTVWLSSGSSTLSGTNYTGTTKVGGSYPAGATITTGTSFYSPGNMIKQLGDLPYSGGSTDNYNYTAGTFINVAVAVSGTTVTFTVTLDEVPNGALVTQNTTVTVTIRPPSTTNLPSNTWGTPSVSITSVAT